MVGPRNRAAIVKAGQCYKAGDLSQAQELCRGILKRDKRDADAIHLLGLIAFQNGALDKATSYYKKCIDLRPREPRFPYLLAKVSVVQTRLDEALRRLDDALKLDPEYVPALTWKAVVFERSGRYDDARALVAPFVEAGTEDADMAEVYARLELQANRPENALAVISHQLAKSQLRPLSRQVLTFARAKAYEKAGNIDDAFEAYQQANTLLAAHFDPEAYVAQIDELIATFSKEALQTLPRAGNDSELPIFIAGMPRSGTTLVDQIIDAHPQVHGAGEITDLETIVSTLAESIGSSLAYPQCITQLTPRSVDGLGRTYLNRVRKLDRASSRIVNKSLENYKHLGVVALLLPKARVIHCRRDPMDTCLSCYLSHLMPGKNPYAADLRHIGLVYRQYERLMLHWQKVLDIPIMDVSYEELIADQERVSREIIEFCGLPWDAQCLAFHASGRVAMTLSYDQVRLPIYSSSVGRWRRFERHLGPLQEALAEHD